MSAVIRVLVVDDHPIVRQGLRTYLATRPGIDVVGEAGDADAAVAQAAELRPDVALVDLVLPGADGVSTIERLHALAAPPRVLVLTSFAGQDRVVPAMRAGASGYLLKDAAPAELEAAIRTVHRGGAVLGPGVAEPVLAEVSRPHTVAGLDELTPREREVLGLLGRGLSNRELAAALVVSEKTVKTHVSSVLSKLHLADRTQAALWAVRNGLTGDG
ncbi:MAG TPA: response regulator transcription factor [Acidimicrobiales bacterium]|nr:response regulator transcription factor [Acidimicrobiales bacterium]